MTRALAPYVCAASLVACGGGATTAPSGAFGGNWQNDQGAGIAALQARLANTPPPPNASVAVGVGEGELVGSALPRGTVWRYRGAADTLPVVAGPLVVATNAGALYALDAETGALRWSVPVEGRKLRGAGDDGTFTVAVVAGGTARESRLVVVDRAGKVVLQLDSEEELGVPAAQGGIAFVPWGDQYCSALDVKSGREVARLLLREQLSRAHNFGGQLWFGERGFTHFDDKIKLSTTNQATRIALPSRELPGKPVWLGSGNDLWPVNTSARLKIRLYATPTVDSGEPHFTNRQYLATYFRVLMGLSESDASLRFVRALDGDALGASPAREGFAACASSGKVTLLSRRGGDAGTLDLGQKLKACTVEASAASFTEQKPPAPLAEQLGEALATLTPEMAVAQRMLVTELGKIEDPVVTKTLIDLTSSSKVPPELRQSARQLLAQRRTGKEYMLRALERHYDYVTDQLLAPPLGPLADALAGMNETAAAPLLAQHLNDPANDMQDVERAAVALGKLATPAEYEDLRTFFVLYRATADEPALVNAVVAIAQALLRIGGEAGRALVERAAEDPLTQTDVRSALPGVLAQSPKGAAPAGAKG